MTKENFDQFVLAISKAILILNNSKDKDRDMMRKLVAAKIYFEIQRDLCEEDEQDVDYDFSDLS